MLQILERLNMKTLLGWIRLLMVLAAMSVSPMALSYTVDTSGTAATGLWWNPSESGWGVTLTHQYDVIFVTMFVYDSTGNPVWYVASNCAVSGAGCTGTLYKVTGGSMPTTTWNGGVTGASVGTINLTFTNTNTGTMNYTINGVSGSKAISRQVFATAPSVAPTANLSSLNNASLNENIVTLVISGSACLSLGVTPATYTRTMDTNITTSGSNAIMTMYDAAAYYTFNLQYQSGNSSTGYDFTGIFESKVSADNASVTLTGLKLLYGTKPGQVCYKTCSTSLVGMSGFFSIPYVGDGCYLSGTL